MSSNRSNKQRPRQDTVLYNDKDSKMLVEKVDDIMKNADSVSSESVEPTIKKVWEIIFTVRDFVIEKKRKIYGGFALNKLIEVKNPDTGDKFYDDANVKDWDIDFYSPDPIGDSREICNRLHAKGFHHITAREAQHDETYKVFAETIDCADITYVPTNIYNKIPFEEIGGMRITGPHFMMIDYFRVMTDPMTSYFRLQKTFVRLCLMLKYYELPHNTSTINIDPPERDLDVALRTVHDFLTNRESTITIGMYAYNHLIRESEINKKGKKVNRYKSNQNQRGSRSNDDQYIDYVDINYYEVISTEYKRDTRDLILRLQEKFLNVKGKITYQENYPFFQYLGYSVNIYCDGEIICRMYHYNTRCVPFFDVPALYFKKSGYEEHEGKIRMGSFATLMMFSLINIMKARTDNDQNTKNLYYTMISHMIDMKNYYFDRTGKNIFDNSLFQEFVIRCVGEMMDPKMEKAVRIEKKKKAGKRYMWMYNPENEKDRESDHKYVFKNSSGNKINNDRNMKIDLSDKPLTKSGIDTDDDEPEAHSLDEPVDQNVKEDSNL
jgi:hypothetical protein